ncbi:MAG: phosphoribosylamine--glycine ligase, partial [Xanthomonadaceae bacterium]|nr:phosphoribosylamine--glycine ligase [Xanthomonadaceae bacterium]
DLIDGLDADFGSDAKVFHAGTQLDAQDRAVTAGGRVLTVCALGRDLAAAREQAYAAVAKIHFDGAFCRRDIAHRALHRR